MKVWHALKRLLKALMVTIKRSEIKTVELVSVHYVKKQVRKRKNAEFVKISLQ